MMYKVLINGKSCHGGNYSWPLPQDGNPGKWTPVIKDPEMCSRGYHLTIEPYNWYKWGSDVYEAEGRKMAGEQFEPHKACFAQARLLKLVEKPEWLVKAEEFVSSLKSIPWLKPDGKPLPEWKLFTADTSTAARDAASNAASTAASNAARDAAWAAARDAARNAARNAASDAVSDAVSDAALQARVIIVNLSGPHAEHVRKRMEVWQKGYALLCDVGGILYVYAKT